MHLSFWTNKPVTRRQILYSSSYMRYLKVLKLINMEGEWRWPGAERREYGKILVNEQRVSFLQDENVSEICSKTIWMYLAPLSCTLKNGEDDVLCVSFSQLTFFFLSKPISRLLHKSNITQTQIALRTEMVDFPTELLNQHNFDTHTWKRYYRRKVKNRLCQGYGCRHPS